MGITRLAAEGVRNLERFEIDPGDGINVVFGENAAGKTSLLEAIYFVSRTRSFRTALPRHMIAAGREGLWVRAEREGHVVGVARDAEGTKVRLDGQDGGSLSEIARRFPVQVINNEHQRLLLDGPEVRRSFLNWAVFHVEPDFQEAWGRYLKALRQRNAALRDQQPKTAWAYDEGLVAAAQAVDALRRQLVELLVPYWLRLVKTWLPDTDLELGYRPGWRSESTLAERLEAQRTLDLQRGFTNSGPHRADLAFRCGGLDAQHRLSRGQQKLLVIALLLAQAQATKERVGRDLTLLVDDLAAELDRRRRQQVLEEIAGFGGQAFLTALTPTELEPAGGGRWFHVEQGRLRPA